MRRGTRPLSPRRSYGFVPEKLYRYRSAAFLSLSKRKEYQSFTMKNMFGIIPDPVRAWWHGPKDAKLAPGILDINKVYAAHFQRALASSKRHTTAYRASPRDVAISNSPVQLVAILNHVAGFDKGTISLRWKQYARRI